MLKRKAVFIPLFIILTSLCFCPTPSKAYAMPFYQLNPQKIVVRATFETSFASSTPERKHNISLASQALNNSFIEPNAEFSFNQRLGVRSEKKGYKNAKIIVDGKFVDGVGGGVCQVSTTLYNALLLSGMNVIEHHPHSLAVSYVSPSCDAMVSYGHSDLKFINCTDNPILIKSSTTNDKLTITILGCPMQEKYTVKSIVTGEIPSTEERVSLENTSLFPDLKEGEKKYLIYPKNGVKSEAYIIKSINGKVIEKKLIRRDKYRSITGVYVEGEKQTESIDNNALRLAIWKV